MMSIVRKLFGFCCCSEPPSCDVCADDFNRSNSSDISTGSACGWTETAGDWSISSNVLSIASTNALATCNTDSPSAERVITVKTLGTNANNLAQVRVGDWRVEVRFSTTAGYIRLINPSGTAVKTSATNLNIALSSFHTLQICHFDGILRASLVGITGGCVSYPASISTLTNGLGTGATVSGSVQFDDWNLDNHSTGCPCPADPCTTSSTCCNGPIYDNVTLIATGIADNGTSSCCDNFNGAIVLPWQTVCTYGYTSLIAISHPYATCRPLNTTAASCGCTGDPPPRGDYCQISVTIDDAGFWRVTYGFIGANCSGIFIQDDFTGTVNCLTEIRDAFDNVIKQSVDRCDWSGATFEVIPGP